MGFISLRANFGEFYSDSNSEPTLKNIGRGSCNLFELCQVYYLALCLAQLFIANDLVLLASRVGSVLELQPLTCSEIREKLLQRSEST